MDKWPSNSELIPFMLYLCLKVSRQALYPSHHLSVRAGAYLSPFTAALLAQGLAL